METGTLSHKRTLKRLQEKCDAGTLEPNALDSNGLSLVHQFAYDGQVTCLKWLLKHGGSVTARSSEGCVAAHYAAAGGHLPILHLLKEQEVDSTGMKDNNYTYPLYIAAQEGQLDVVIWLTKHSSIPGSEAAKDGMTALHAAAQEGHLDCVRYLVQLADCSPLQADLSGCTPLHFAAAEGHSKVVKWLLEYGGAQANMRDKTGSTASHLVAEYNQIRVMKTLAKLDISLALQDDTGRTPMDICDEKGHVECLEFLREWLRVSSGSPNEAQQTRSLSLKKVRFDENGESECQANGNEASVEEENAAASRQECKDEEDYLRIAEKLSEDCLKEKVKKNREEWKKSTMTCDGVDDIAQGSMRGGVKGERWLNGGKKVGKRRSFKDKNVKYQVKDRNNNKKESLSMIFGRLQKRIHNGDNKYGSAKVGERPHPDLIQCAINADRNASVGFRRRPSLEFFQDLRSQVRATKGKDNMNQGQVSPRTQLSVGDPVRIYQNGTLKTSRENLSNLHQQRKQDNTAQGSVEVIAIQIGEINDKPNDRPNEMTAIGKSEVNGSSSKPVIKESKKSDKAKNKLKLPKGLAGILPKSMSTPNLSNGQKISKNSTKKNATMSKAASTQIIEKEANSKEHYLIRSLPLPNNGWHMIANHDKVSFYSSNLTNSQKQTSSKWSSVRESFGSFFSSLRSKRREKMYEVTGLQGSERFPETKQESNKRFSFPKSLPSKKRKSISLEHMPNFSSTGEQIKVTNSGKSEKSTTKRLSQLQPGYTEPDIYKLTSMALDDTLKGKVTDSTDDVAINVEPKPEESLDFIVSKKNTTGFHLDSLQVNNEEQVETGSALMY
eukprot:gene16763-18457_t